MTRLGGGSAEQERGRQRGSGGCVRRSPSALGGQRPTSWGAPTPAATSSDPPNGSLISSEKDGGHLERTSVKRRKEKSPELVSCVWCMFFFFFECTLNYADGRGSGRDLIQTSVKLGSTLAAIQVGRL